MPITPYLAPSYAPLTYLPGALFADLGASAPTSFEVGLVSYLAALGIIAYPGHVPQTASLPAYTYSLITGTPKYTLKSAAGLNARTYQFSCLSTVFLDTVNMELALASALSGFSGLFGTTYVSSCRLDNALDLPFAANVDGSDDGTYQRSADYRFLFRESIPTF